MASNSYMSGRQKYSRPQAMLWSDTPGVLSEGKYIPAAYEDQSDLAGISSTDRFIILSDHNRQDINIQPQRIEQRTRMANGTMRSYHIADKLVLSTSWTMLPSRSFAGRPNFDQSTGVSDFSIASQSPNAAENQYTVDGGAGGNELLNWYQNHTGPFWVFLSYDKYINFGSDTAAYGNLAEYNQVIKMYISSFDYSIVKRGATNFDMWNINVTLEEV